MQDPNHHCFTWQVEERMATLNARDVDMMAWAFAKVNADTELMARSLGLTI